MNSKMLLLFCVVQIIQYSCGRDQHYRRNETYLRTTSGSYKVHDTSNTWLEAKKICADEGAQLFYPETQEESDVVISFLKETRGFRHKLLVGLSDMVAEGVFESIDGKGLYDLPHKWNSGEPNDADRKEDCVEMESNGLLNDIECTAKRQLFICKSAPLELNQPCNMAIADYVYNKTLGRCYKFHTNPLDWSDAHLLCAAEQSYLAVINSQQEADYLVELSGQKHKHETGDFVILGFHNLFDGIWTTVKGTSVEVSGYESWAAEQPDGGDRDKCGSMFYDGLLNDIGCDKKSFFICEHEILY